MPFKSQKQRAYFHHLKSIGKMDQETIDKWEAHTPKDKKLPERVEKKAMLNSFWNGFSKKAEENFVSANPIGDIPGAPEKMLKWNPHGGVDPRTPEDLQAAEAAGLITLPPDVEGASCGTCMYFRPITPELMHGFCTNPIVKQDVTARMHCTGWLHPGSHDSVAAAQEEAQQAQVEQAQLGMQGSADGQAMAGSSNSQKAVGIPDGQAMAGGNVNPANQQPTSDAEMAGEGVQSETGKPSPIGSVQGAPAPGPTSANPLAQQALNSFQGEDTPGAASGGASEEVAPAKAPKEKKPKSEKKPSDKKDSEGKGNTINIHVGKDNVKTSSFEFWRGIVDGY